MRRRLPRFPDAEPRAAARLLRARRQGLPAMAPCDDPRPRPGQAADTAGLLVGGRRPSGVAIIGAPPHDQAPDESRFSDTVRTIGALSTSAASRSFSRLCSAHVGGMAAGQVDGHGPVDVLPVLRAQGSPRSVLGVYADGWQVHQVNAD